jgi:phenylacetate-CoA ligase
VVGPDGRHSVRFHSIFIELPHVLQGQVVQEGRDEFRVRVIAEDGFGASEEGLICQRIKARLGSVNVHVERVTELERTRTGKIRAVISRIPNGTRAEAVDPPHV